MKVCVSIPGVQPLQAAELVDELKKKFEGIAEVAAVCGTMYGCPDTVVIRVTTDDKKYNENIEMFRELKQRFPQAKVRVEAFQEGGGWSNTGSCTVTALADGSMPVRVAGGGYCNSVHAVYWITEGFVIECGYWNKRDYCWKGSIDFVQVNFNGFKKYTVGKFRATSIEDIEIQPEKPELFRNLNKLLPAIKATCKKAVCYHCREEHTF